MKKSMLILSLFTSLSFAGGDFNFDSAPTQNANSKKAIQKSSVSKSSTSIVKPQKNENTSSEASSFGSSASDDAAPIPVKEDAHPGIELTIKNYSDVHYVKGYDWFSIINPDSYKFNEYLIKYNMNDEDFQNKLANNDTSDNMVLLSALYFDYVKKQPEMAENYYLAFNKIHIDRSKKILLVDYLIRTGRYKGMTNTISVDDINSFIGCSGANYEYYRGVMIYLNTKVKNSQEMTHASRCGVKKAQDFIN